MMVNYMTVGPKASTEHIDFLQLTEELVVLAFRNGQAVANIFTAIAILLPFTSIGVIS